MAARTPAGRSPARHGRPNGPLHRGARELEQPVRVLLAALSGHGAIGRHVLGLCPLGCPLAERLAHDFVPLPPSFFKRLKVRQLFVRVSLLWALVSLTNAAGTLALLLNVPIATFLAAKTGLSWALTVGGVVLSSWWFRRGLRRANAEALETAE